MEYSQEEINLAFDYFTVKAQEIVNNYMESNFPTLPKQIIDVSEGSVYWKLVRMDDAHAGTITYGIGSTVYAFVRKSDGAIFRAASYKAPQTKGKHAVRAYVTDEWASGVLTPHGVAYVR